MGLRFLGGLTPKDAASEFGVSVSAANSKTKLFIQAVNKSFAIDVPWLMNSLKQKKRWTDCDIQRWTDCNTLVHVSRTSEMSVSERWGRQKCTAGNMHQDHRLIAMTVDFFDVN